MSSVDRSHALAYLGLIVTFTLWSGNNVLARAIVNDIPPVTLAFWRWSVALAVLLPLSYRHLSREWTSIKPELKRLATLAAVGIASFNTLLYTAAATTSAINIALVAQLMPVVTLLIAWLAIHNRPARWQLIGVVVSVAGATIIISRGSVSALATLSFAYGDLIMLWGVCCTALYSILYKLYDIKLHPLTILTLIVTFSVPMILPFYLWERLYYGDPALTAENLGAILYAGIFAAALGTVLFNNGISVTGPSTAAMFSYLQPVITIILAAAILGEQLAIFHALGGLLIMVGVFLAVALQGPR